MLAGVSLCAAFSLSAVAKTLPGVDNRQFGKDLKLLEWAV